MAPTGEQRAAWQRDGFVVARELFDAAETRALLDHYMAMHQHRVDSGEVPAAAECADDPLRAWPRMLQMHRWDEVSLRWLVDARINAVMTGLLGAEPYAVQTMIYFKPPGARGQALHQDQYYLQVRPGTCCAAWMALDRCDEENGCLMVVPGSHELPVLCTIASDPTQSFTEVTVPLPETMVAVPVIMEPGDVLFFNGQVIHGSLPNVSRDRFRRALIGHYCVGEAEAISRWYHPVLAMNGEPIEFGESSGGGPCGNWVDRDGRLMVEAGDQLVPAPEGVHG